MDGRARWYRLRIHRPASYPQHSRSASFDAEGGPASQFQGDGQQDGGDVGGGETTGRRRTTPGNTGTSRAPITSGTGRAATCTTALLHSTADVIIV